MFQSVNLFGCNRPLIVHPKSNSFFYSEVQNFTVLPKRPSIFLSEIQSFKTVSKWPFILRPFVRKYGNCMQMVTRFFDNKITKSGVGLKRAFVFLLQTTKMELN